MAFFRQNKGQVHFVDITAWLGFICLMARPLRIEYPSAVYHVTSRGNEKKPVFKDEEDRYTFLDTL